jgi:hypothetical protein
MNSWCSLEHATLWWPINKHCILDAVQLQQVSGPQNTKNRSNGVKSRTSLHGSDTPLLRKFDKWDIQTLLQMVKTV